MIFPLFGVCETWMVLILTTSIHQFLKLAETLGRDEIYNWGNFILRWSPLRDLSVLLVRKTKQFYNIDPKSNLPPLFRASFWLNTWSVCPSAYMFCPFAFLKVLIIFIYGGKGARTGTNRTIVTFQIKRHSYFGPNGQKSVHFHVLLFYLGWQISGILKTQHLC